jgi:catechol 2,3-dioxygenase-like lactoylglutathione lyase family enzyme
VHTDPDTPAPVATLGAVVLDCREPRRVAEFYSAVLGAPVDGAADGDWVQLEPTAPGAPVLAFQLAPGHEPPRWPDDAHPQQAHLDLDVPDLDAAERRVLALGARRHPHQPGEDFRVFLDPAGHPFCLCAP